MALLCAAIKRDFFLQVASSQLRPDNLMNIFSVCRLKYPYSYFSSYFFPDFFVFQFDLTLILLILLFFATVINVSLLIFSIFLESLNCPDAILRY